MYNHLTHAERCQIYALNKRGISVRGIACDLQRSPSTISRELCRNRGLRGYRHEQAQRLATDRRHNSSCIPSKMNESLEQLIRDKLSIMQWSPEQISGWLKANPERGQAISHEWIYQYIWADKRAGGTLYKHLRHHGKKYNKRKHSKNGRGMIPNRRDISERPAIVEEKSRIGDWEGDTIIGKNHRGVLLSLVDRHSKVTLLARLPAKKARLVEQAITLRLQPFKEAVHTITFDNGMEFANHQNIAENLNADCFFATPYHSWERGLNEHTNGLVRQYFPKKTNLAMLTHGNIAKVQWLLNNRPRKILNFKTPAEVFSQALNLSNTHPVALRC